MTTKWNLASLAATILAATILALSVGPAGEAQEPMPPQGQPMPQSQWPTQEPSPAGPGQAQQGPQQGWPQGQDPALPDSQPGVARVSLIQGNVSTQRSDSGEWVAVTPNTPVAAGDSISTGPGSRAELELDYASILRLAPGANARIANLTAAQIQVQIGQGLVNYSVLRQSDAAIEIETPNVAIHPAGPGEYRVVVNGDESQLIVRSGSADVSTPQGTTRVNRGEIITIRGADNPQYQTSPAPAGDDWDRWNGDRDRLIAGASSWQHTDPYYVGSQDLDTYGQWDDVPDYGSVWFPAQNAGWAPYRDGRWVWEPVYGWTWVSYEPWGWAPYHYGRWFVSGGRWGWWPGPVAGFPRYRPLWAPAYVSFLGWGGVSVGVGFGYGNVGWLPIGPGDFFYPWYGRFGGRVNVINAYNVHNFRAGGIGPLGRPGMQAFSNVNGAFTDGRIRAGVTSMPAGEFGRGRVSLNQRPVDAGALRQAGFMTGRLPVAPTQASFRATDRAVTPAEIPNRAANSQRFFSSSRGIASSRTFNAQTAQAAARTVNERPASPMGTPQNGGRGFGAASPGGSAPQNWQAGRGTAQGGNMTQSYRPQSSPRSSGQSETNGGTGRQSGWQGFNPSSGARSLAPQGSVSSSRPALDMRQQIVTPRAGPSSSGGFSRQGGGESHGASPGGRQGGGASRSGGAHSSHGH